MRNRRSGKRLQYGGFYDPEGPVVLGIVAMIGAVLWPFAAMLTTKGWPLLGISIQVISITALIAAIGYAIYEHRQNRRGIEQQDDEDKPPKA